ncbi:hypothetical protein AB3538_11755 [Acinetobacter baumannii]
MDNLQTNIAVVTQQRAKHTKTRYYILAMIFLVTAFNYGDRATLSMAATPMSHELGIDSVTMGYIFLGLCMGLCDWSNSRRLATR